jgi:hypothetical protein
MRLFEAPLHLARVHHDRNGIVSVPALPLILAQDLELTLPPVAPHQEAKLVRRLQVTSTAERREDGMEHREVESIVSKPWEVVIRGTSNALSAWERIKRTEKERRSLCSAVTFVGEVVG